MTNVDENLAKFMEYKQDESYIYLNFKSSGQPSSVQHDHLLSILEILILKEWIFINYLKG